MTYGIESTWPDSHTKKPLKHISVPCEIEFWEGKEIHRGSIAYCQSEKGECFHRCFSSKAPNEMVAEILEKGFWEMDFPALTTSLEGSKNLSGTETLHEGGCEIKHVNGYTTEIIDRKNKATIRTFNMNYL